MYRAMQLRFVLSRNIVSNAFDIHQLQSQLISDMKMDIVRYATKLFTCHGVWEVLRSVWEGYLPVECIWIVLSQNELSAIFEILKVRAPSYNTK